MTDSRNGDNWTKLDSRDTERVQQALRRGWSRRDVLKLMMASGITATTAHHLLSDQQAAFAATPNKGGTLRAAMNLHGPDDTLDPALFTSGIDYTRGRVTYNNLTQLDESLTAQPDLAESFEPNSNATEWTFKLRKGVKWHDGTPFTADDVVYTMRRHQGEDSTSNFKSMLEPVTEWKKTGTHEVKVVLATPNSDLPAILGLFQAKVIKNSTNGDGIGTGPFTLESFEPGIKSVHKRNEDYWREPAHLETIEMTAITDPVARVNALIAGDVHMAATVEPNSFRQIEDSSTAKLNSIPAGQQIGVCALLNASPGNNQDWLRGFQYIQDRKRIVKRVLKGKGTVGNDHPIAPAPGLDFSSAVSGVEIALWDAYGKSYNAPVYDLLGGALTHQVPLYINTWTALDSDIPALAERCQRLIAEGYCAVKIYPRKYGNVKEAGECVRAVREALGDDIDIALDLSLPDNAYLSLQIAREVAPYRPYWFEEPISGEHLEVLADIRRQSGLRIVTGEKHAGKEHARDVLVRRAADILNTDIAGCGGIIEMLEIGAMADAHAVFISPHCWNSMTLALAAMLHTCAVMPNAELAEIYPDFLEHGKQFCRLEFNIENGVARLGDAPGLGITIDEVALTAISMMHSATSP